MVSDEGRLVESIAVSVDLAFRPVETVRFGLFAVEPASASPS